MSEAWQAGDGPEILFVGANGEYCLRHSVWLAAELRCDRLTWVPHLRAVANLTPKDRMILLAADLAWHHPQEALGRLRMASRTAHIIVLSRQPRMADAVSFIRAGAADYVQVPEAREALLALLRLHWQEFSGRLEVGEGRFSEWRDALRNCDTLPTLKSLDSQLVAEALHRAGGRQCLAARLLGVTPQALNARLKRHGEIGDRKK